jgi:hypothetical protein
MQVLQQIVHFDAPQNIGRKHCAATTVFAVAPADAGAAPQGQQAPGQQPGDSVQNAREAPGAPPLTDSQDDIAYGKAYDENR